MIQLQGLAHSLTRSTQFWIPSQSITNVRIVGLSDAINFKGTDSLGDAKST
jgi:hypothetical protein